MDISHLRVLAQGAHRKGMNLPSPCINKVWAWLDPHSEAAPSIPVSPSRASHPPCPWVSHEDALELGLGLPLPRHPTAPRPCLWGGSCPLSPAPTTVLPAHITFNYPDTSRRLPAKVPD